MESSNEAVVDLFCGAGGLTRGLKNIGLNVVAGIDLNEKCQYTYEVNNDSKFICRDLHDTESKEVLNLFGDVKIKILVGCAPCQPFSSLTQKKKEEEHKEDKRWSLLEDFGRIICDIKPDIVSMENVPQIITKEPFLNFIKTMEDNGYHISYSIVKCEEYGIPQKRHRLVLLASRHGDISIILPEKKKITVKEAIGNMEKLDAGKTSDADVLHRCQGMTEINVKRIIESKPGGTWEDWSDELISECHRKKSGHSFSAMYSRMKWDEPAPTITTQFYNYGSGRFGHPEQNRALSLREGALLQTFPSNYIFFNSDEISLNLNDIAMQIGNAVPVKLGEIIGNSIKNHIESLDKCQK